MSLVHPVMPPADVGGMMMEDIQLEQQYQTAPLVQQEIIPHSATDAAMLDRGRTLLNSLVPGLRLPSISDLGDGPWPMEQDTDFLPIITTLLKILHLEPGQSTIDHGDATGLMNPVDVAANALHAAYYRGFNEAKRRELLAEATKCLNRMSQAEKSLAEREIQLIEVPV
jgi:hypothetical protein